MPNHITNEVKVIGGTNKERLAFIRSITNKYGRIDFNNITRMPKSMRIEESNHVEEMASAIAGVQMARYSIRDIQTPKALEAEIRKNGYKSSYIRKVQQQALMRINNKRLYGFYSWYDWSLEKWGTKWNAYEVEMPVKQKRERIKRGYKRRGTHIRAYQKRLFKKRLARHAFSGAELVIRFETAWSCPEPIFHEMAKNFPHLEFLIRYADEDMGSNCGSIHMLNGKFNSVDIAPSWSQQSEEERLKWIKFAFEVRYPGDTPQQHDMDENYNYLDS